MKWSTALSAQVCLSAIPRLARARDYLPGTTWTICANASTACAQANVTFAYLVSDAPLYTLQVFLLSSDLVLVSILSIRIGSPRNAQCDDEHPVPPAQLGDSGRHMGGQAKCRHSLLKVFSRPFFL